MNVEYTGRQTAITKQLKTQTEAGLERIAKVLGDAGSVHVIFTTEKYRRAAELTVQTRNLKLVASCEATEMETALHDALAALEKQVVKYKKRKTTIKRNMRHTVRDAAIAPAADGTLVVEVEPQKAVHNGTAKRSVPMLVHSFPSQSPLMEPHLVRSHENVALRPMTIEEAVKEAAFRDREVFVFRDHGGQAMVLYRKRDGRMELIEVP